MAEHFIYELKPEVLNSAESIVISRHKPLCSAPGTRQRTVQKLCVLTAGARRVLRRIKLCLRLDRAVASERLAKGSMRSFLNPLHFSVH
jgi:hypothetical protein